MSPGQFILQNYFYNMYDIGGIYCQPIAQNGVKDFTLFPLCNKAGMIQMCVDNRSPLPLIKEDEFIVWIRINLKMTCFIVMCWITKKLRIVKI